MYCIFFYILIVRLVVLSHITEWLNYLFNRQWIVTTFHGHVKISKHPFKNSTKYWQYKYQFYILYIIYRISKYTISYIIYDAYSCTGYSKTILYSNSLLIKLETDEERERCEGVAGESGRRHNKHWHPGGPRSHLTQRN